MKIAKRKKKRPSGRRGPSPSEHWTMFEKGELRGRSQNPEWLELYLLLWFYQHAQRHGSKQVAPEVVVEALQVKAPPAEEMRKIYREVQSQHTTKLVSFQKSWALVRRGVLPKNAHFLYLWLHRYADPRGELSLPLEELVLRTRLPAQVLSYGLEVLIKLRLVERIPGTGTEDVDGHTEDVDTHAQVTQPESVQEEQTSASTMEENPRRVHVRLERSRIPWC